MAVREWLAAGDLMARRLAMEDQISAHSVATDLGLCAGCEQEGRRQTLLRHCPVRQRLHREALDLIEDVESALLAAARRRA